MKVILKGIIPYDPETQFTEKEFKGFKNLLEQISYPIQVNAEEFQLTVDLNSYIDDPLYPNSNEIWGLAWFDYEEVKE